MYPIDNTSDSVELLLVGCSRDETSQLAGYLETAGHRYRAVTIDEFPEALQPAKPSLVVVGDCPENLLHLLKVESQWRKTSPHAVLTVVSNQLGVAPASVDLNALLENRLVDGMFSLSWFPAVVRRQTATLSELARLRFDNSKHLASPSERSSRTLEALVKSRTEQLQSRNRRLEYLATRDPLTGLFNRRYLQGRLEGEMSRLQRYSTAFSVAIFDLDDFKKVNDVYGHPAGDTVLSTVAKVLQNSVRGVDCLGRFGGEEFLVLLPNTNQEQALVMAQRLCDTLANSPVQLDDGTMLEITSSGGVAHGLPSDGSWQQVFQRADGALYQSKKAGKNRISVAQAEAAAG